MPSFVGQPLDGEYSGNRRPIAPLAPEDRAPQFITVPAARVPASGANGLVIEFPAWTRWVQVEDDGGAALLIEDVATSKVTVATSGSFVWVGKRKIRVTNNGTAPTSLVKLYGLSQEDALVLSAATAINVANAAPVTPAKQNIYSVLPLVFVGFDGITYTYTRSAAQGVAGGKYRVQSAPVIQAGQAPADYNESDSVLVIGGAAAGPTGGGIRLYPGGDVEVDGVFYAIEVAHIFTGAEVSPSSFLEIQRIS